MTYSGPNFALTDEHEMIRREARRFAQEEIAPIAAEYDETGDFPSETVKKMGQMGFMGIEVPEQYGGAGMDSLSYVLALEEICKADASHGTIMSVALHQTDPKQVYIGARYDGEVFGTQDAGDSWQSMNLPHGVKDIYSLACG